MKKMRSALKILACLIILAIIWQIPKKIIIKHIDCESQYGACSPRLQELLRKYIGSNVSAAKKDIRAELTESVKEDLLIKYHYPGTLRVVVYETEPVFAFTNTEETDFRLIDHEGYVVSQSGETSLPYAKVTIELPAIGEKIDDRYLFALSTLRDLAKSYEIQRGEITDEGLLVELPTKTKVLFPLDGDRDTILGSFVLVINQLNSVKATSTMEKAATVAEKTVDLRFKNPVIR